LQTKGIHKVKKKKNNFNSAFKAKIACAALRESKSTNEIASENGVHPTQINQWKKIITEHGASLFDGKNDKNKKGDVDMNELQRIIGEQAIQLAWYKKKFGISN
jgi:transposase-like protein